MRNCGALLLVVTTACSNAGGEDAGSIAGLDAAVQVTDATIVDVGLRYDGGVIPQSDAGYGDPATLIDDLITIAGARTYVRVRGTTTSTMPPLVVLNTGPMMGHEYLVEPLDFLLGPGGREDPNRLMLFYDMRATGRSGFGSIASSTITIDAHVSDLVDVLQWFDHFTERSGPVDVLAHGYGAAVATLFAVEHPERFRRMVYVTPYPSNILEQADYGATINNRLNTGDRERLSELSQWNYCLRDIPRCSRDAWNIVGPTWLCPDHRDRKSVV